MNNISGNSFNPSLRPAKVQADRLKELPEKHAYNEFVDAALQSPQFMDSSSEQAKELSRMARAVANSIPEGDNRFALYQACFDAAIDGSVAATAGGPASLVARTVLQTLPQVEESARTSVMGTALGAIADRAVSTPEAQQHAEFALNAGTRASHTSKATQSIILQNGLGAIAELDTPPLS